MPQTNVEQPSPEVNAPGTPNASSQQFNPKRVLRNKVFKIVVFGVPVVVVLLTLLVIVGLYQYSGQHSKKTDEKRNEYAEKLNRCGHPPIVWTRDFYGVHSLIYDVAGYEKTRALIDSSDEFYCTFTEFYTEHPEVTPRDIDSELKALKSTHEDWAEAQIEAYR